MQDNAGSDLASVGAWITAVGSLIFAFLSVVDGDNLVAGAIAMLAAAVAFGNLVGAQSKPRAP
jgi:hypothetical protein